MLPTRRARGKDPCAARCAGSCCAENTGWRMLSLAADSSSLERLRLATACELWLLCRRWSPSLGRAALPSRSSPAGSSPSPATGKSFLAQLPPPATSTADPDGDTDTLSKLGLGDPPRRRMMPGVAGADEEGRRFDEASTGFASRPLDESAMGAATRQARARTIRPPEWECTIRIPIPTLRSASAPSSDFRDFGVPSTRQRGRS